MSTAGSWRCSPTCARERPITLRSRRARRDREPGARAVSPRVRDCDLDDVRTLRERVERPREHDPVATRRSHVILRRPRRPARVELGRRRVSIRVNAVMPGFVVGDQNRSLLVRDDGQLTERAAQIVAHTPLSRLGLPEDIASAVLWLLSDGAGFVTGALVPVDGGFSAAAGV